MSSASVSGSSRRVSGASCGHPAPTSSMPSDSTKAVRSPCSHSSETPRPIKWLSDSARHQTAMPSGRQSVQLCRVRPCNTFKIHSASSGRSGSRLCLISKAARTDITRCSIVVPERWHNARAIVAAWISNAILEEVMVAREEPEVVTDRKLTHFHVLVRTLLAAHAIDQDGHVTRRSGQLRYDARKVIHKVDARASVAKLLAGWQLQHAAHAQHWAD
eukprot:CAMPEP_0183331904 /NCGR_PEP_ID=MMETSP0164_2-20130417/1206_1 /TAXON_ID=221442 /ORGANISM="Coccolithus pelagicus ssp braarudi, Strain PLY182g" /LENGTH=216 /DNA_ID=CAMNT_0025500507 /DNA_START=178 /DNA_END=828 /DNA_ORIENTATION=-